MGWKNFLISDIGSEIRVRARGECINLAGISNASSREFRIIKTRIRGGEGGSWGLIAPSCPFSTFILVPQRPLCNFQYSST